MNRSDAKKIAETITNQELQEMFDAAKKGIKDWTARSHINSGITKGVAWNILASKFDLSHNYHHLAKVNMIREFGDFLLSKVKPKKKQLPIPVHSNPIFERISIIM